jgi:hypothetical protein
MWDRIFSADAAVLPLRHDWDPVAHGEGQLKNDL